jgi:dynactin complex subunit
MSDASGHRALVIDITSDNEQQVPKEALDFLGEVVTGGSEAEKADLAALLSQRLQEPSISVKLKVLRVIMVLAGKGGSGFAEHLRSRTLHQMQAHTEFQAPPDPKHGEKPKLMIRAAAVKCIRTVEEQLAAPAQPRAEVDPLAAAVEQLAAKVQQMDAKSTALEDRFAGLEAWLADVEDKLAARPAAASGVSDDGALLETLQIGQAAAGDRLSSVEEQLAAARAELAQAKASIGTAEDSTQQRLAEQQLTLEAAQSEIAGIGSRVDTLDTLQASSAEAAAASLAALEAGVARDLDQLRAAAPAAPTDSAGAAAAAAAAAAAQGVDSGGSVRRDELDALTGRLGEMDERLAEQESLVSVVDETAAKTEEDLSRLVAAQEGSLKATVAECVDRAVSSLQLQAPASAQDETPQPASVTSAQFSEWSDLQNRRMVALEQQFASSVADVTLAREASAETSGAIDRIDETISTQQQNIEAALSDIAGLREKLNALDHSHLSSVDATTTSMSTLQTGLERQSEQLKLMQMEAATPQEATGAVGAAGLDAVEARLNEYQSSVDASVLEKVDAAISSLKGLCVGDRCEVITEGCRGTGTVGYTGRVDGKDGIWLGVELDEANGRNDGSVQGRRYFACAQGRGVFVPPEKVRKITVSEAMATALEAERSVTLATLQLLREDRAKDQEAQAAKAQRVDAQFAEVEKSSAGVNDKIQATHSQVEQVKEQLLGIDALVSAKVQVSVEELDVRLAEQEGLLSVVDELAQKVEEDVAKSVTAIAEHRAAREAVESDLRSQVAAVGKLAAPESIDAKVTGTVALLREEHSKRFAATDAEVKRLSEVISSCSTIEQVRSVEGKATERLRELAKLVDGKIDRVDSNVERVDGKIEEASASLDAVQDACQQRIDAMQQWVQQMEVKVTTAEASTAQGLEATAALDAAMKGLVSTDVVQSLAKGIKSQLDAIRAETEATEGKVLELLKKHMALSEQKLLSAIGKDEFDRYVEDTDDRCKLLEERFEAVLLEAQGQREAAENAIVDLQQTLASQAEQAERQQEPLSIRVSCVEVRYADGKSSKP